MKKTIIALMALAGMAVAAEPLTLNFGVNVASDANWSQGVTFTGLDESVFSMNYTGTTGYVGTTEGTYNENDFTKKSCNFYSPKVQFKLGTQGSYWQLGFKLAASKSVKLNSLTLNLDAKDISGNDWNTSSALGNVTLTLYSSTNTALGDVTVQLNKDGDINTSHGTYPSTATIQLSQPITLDSTATQFYLQLKDVSNDQQGFVALTGGTIGYTVVSDPATPVVPEPTTATLSLLALAGLAARRRRK